MTREPTGQRRAGSRNNGSGAPPGFQNAFKHGMYSGNTQAFERKLTGNV